MRLRGRQARFVAGTLGGWVSARTALWWLGTTGAGLGIAGGVALIPALMPPSPYHARTRGFVPGRAFRSWQGAAPSLARTRADVPQSAPLPMWANPRRAPQLVRMAVGGLYGGTAGALLRRAVYHPPASPHGDAAPFQVRPATSQAGSRWSGSATAFVRPGSGAASLAGGGQLGGSQLALRLAYRLNPGSTTRTAAAVRLYAPLGQRGAEAAVGLDWYPMKGVPLRFSIERRLRLDRYGRDAWSAYAAGGFYREHESIVLDGYAQAGVVGARSRDLFVDGAVRGGYKLPLGPVTAIVGAGAWGAAQPGAERLDAGPRIGVTVPLADHSLSIALDGRLRVAGHARPGSGAALTLGFDL